MQQLDNSWDKLRSLPNQAQQQVIDFIAFLDEKYKVEPEVIEESLPEQYSNNEFIGIWKNRPEMKNSSAFVRESRKKEWGNE